MAFSLPLPRALRKARWKVKIRNKESREPPHVTIIRGARAWRIDLRKGTFMDAEPDPDDVPSELIAYIMAAETWDTICQQWDQMYPNNPVSCDD